MGRRAKKAPVQTKKRPKLAKRFKCPFCANEDTVECKMDMKALTGSLRCRLCGAAYQMPINHLHEPIDVFSEWLDDCEAAAQPKDHAGGAAAAGGGGAPRYEDDGDEEDDHIPEGMPKKKPAKASGGGAGQRETFEDLGDFDEEDDDDE